MSQKKLQNKKHILTKKTQYGRKQTYLYFGIFTQPIFGHNLISVTRENVLHLKMFISKNQIMWVHFVCYVQSDV